MPDASAFLLLYGYVEIIGFNRPPTALPLRREGDRVSGGGMREQTGFFKILSVFKRLPAPDEKTEPNPSAAHAKLSIGARLKDEFPGAYPH